MFNRFHSFAGNIAGNANPNAAFVDELTPILIDFLKRLKDCLLNRFAPPPQGATEEEFPDPLPVAAAASYSEQAQAIKDRIDANKSSRPLQIAQWGGYKPPFVRRGMATLRRTAEDHNAKLTLAEIKQHVIATYDQADGMTVEELADVLEDEAAEAQPAIL